MTEKTPKTPDYIIETLHLVDKEAIAKLLQCSVSQVDVLRQKGLPFVRLGGCVRFDAGIVKKWIENQMVTKEETTNGKN